MMFWHRAAYNFIRFWIELDIKMKKNHREYNKLKTDPFSDKIDLNASYIRVYDEFDPNSFSFVQEIHRSNKKTHRQTKKTPKMTKNDKKA